MDQTVDRARVRPPPAFVEFVGLIALAMGLTALSIDVLLPAFPPIQAAYALTDPNRPQLLVYAYMIGFGLAQLVYGPAADIVGRRPVMVVGLAIYAAATLVALFAPSFEVLIAARLVQGIGTAAARILALAIVRDRFEGREMARVMSLTMMVFLLVPIVAPAIGAAILEAGNWHLVFAVMLVLDLVLLVWFLARMPETLRPEYRVTFSAAGIGRGFALTGTNRTAFGYGTGLGLMFGCIMAYVGSAQQIFVEVYGLGRLFPVVFAAIALAMAAATLVNTRLVRRVGMRRMANGGLIGFVAVAVIQVAVVALSGGRPPLWLFMTVLAAEQFLLSLVLPNYNALAMEPLGEVAGTASSVIGFYTTLLGALAGLVVGQAFDGTVLPMSLGYAAFGALALAVVAWTERGRLLRG